MTLNDVPGVLDALPATAPIPVPRGPTQPSARNVIIMGGTIVVLGAVIVVLTLGNLTGTLAGGCCGLGGILLIAVALLGRRGLRPLPVGTTPGAAPTEPEAEWVCGKCGADLRPGATFCGTCGEPVEE